MAEHNVKVTFTNEMATPYKKVFTVIFTTDVALEKFVKTYQNYGGYRQFSWTMVDWDCEEDYIRVNNSLATFIMLMMILVPNFEKMFPDGGKLNKYLSGKLLE